MRCEEESRRLHTEFPIGKEPVMHSDDFVFRFSLESRERSEPDGEALAAMTREQLSNILDIIIPYYRGERVRIDSFAFANQPERRFKLIEKKADDEER